MRKRKTNPKGKHLPGATAKQNRQYAHILKSEIERGIPLRDAKRIAAATVRSRQNPARISRSDIAKFPPHIQAQLLKQIGSIEEKEEKVESAPTNTPAQRKRVAKQKSSVEKQKRSLISKIIAKMRHLAGPSHQKISAKEARKGKRFQNAGRKTTKRRPRNPSYTVEAIPRWTGTVKEKVNALTRGSAIRKVRSKVPGPKNIYRYRVEKNPMQRRTPSDEDLYVGPTKRVKIGKGKEIVMYWVPSRKRYVTIPDKKNPTRKGMRKGYGLARREAKARERLGPGFKEAGEKYLRYHARKSRHGKNPSRRGTPSLASLLKFKERPIRGKDRRWIEKEITRANNAIQFLREWEYNTSSASESQKIIKEMSRIRSYAFRLEDALSRYRNPTRRGMRRGYAHGRKVSKRSYPRAKGFEELLRQDIEETMRRKARRKRHGKNPSPAEIRREFSGSVSGARDLYFPEGTPQGLAKLGKLVSITTEEGVIKPVAGTAWLVADTHGKLHLGSTSGAPLYDGPKRSFGQVTKLEYEDLKKHLGYTKPTIFFHHVGEKNGIRPTLHADGRGGLVFKGGDYRIGPRGLEN